MVVLRYLQSGISCKKYTQATVNEHGKVSALTHLTTYCSSDFNFWKITVLYCSRLPKVKVQQNQVK